MVTTTDIAIENSEYLRKYRLWNLEELEREQAARPKNNGPVADFLTHRGVSFLVGDSGLGKSPLAYQLGICVSAGIPFLGMPTNPGTVVYFDHENGPDVSVEMGNRLSRFLGLEQVPQEFRIWTPESGADRPSMESVCAELKPTLVIVDSLRSHNAEFEKHDNTGDLMIEWTEPAKEYGTTIFGIHHTRKRPRESQSVPLLDSENTMLMDWLNEASGSRALINQSDTRIAIDIPDHRKEDAAALVMRWHIRFFGTRGPLYLDRVCDEMGEPLGYIRRTGLALLGNQEQKDAFKRLPVDFGFADAKRVYGCSDDPTRKWLMKCRDLGLLEQPKRGSYKKLVE